MRAQALGPLAAPALLALAACSAAGNPPAPDFSISLQPAVLNLRLTENAAVRVLVNRSGGFAQPVTVSLAGDTGGLTVGPLTVEGADSEGTLTVSAGEAAPTGTSFPVVRAAGGGLTRSETLTVRVAAAVARVNAVSVGGNAGSLEVRQGAGPITLEVSGGNLDRATRVALGDLAPEVIPGGTASRLTLRAVVPHGASLGPRDLVLTSAGGETRFPALVVTAITAGPAGNDAAGRGTTGRPYRSLRRAVSAAGSGDTVRLLDGTYGEASGEVWPRQTGFPPAVAPGANLPAGLRVQGESAAGTILQGAGGDSVGLVLAGTGAASSLTLRGFGRGLLASEGSVTLRDVRTEGNADGILAYGTAVLDVRGGSSLNNAGAGVRAAQKAAVSLSGFEAGGNAVGVLVEGEAALVASGLRARDNRADGLRATGRAAVELDRSEIFGNGRAGLFFGGARLRARGLLVRDNAESGAYVEGDPDLIDLGTFSEAGNNEFRGNGPNGNGDQLLDARPDYTDSLGEVVFTVSATTLNGRRPSPDVYVGLYLDAPYFSVLGRNNLVQFH